jgi:2-iminobutanoate/2-iminopropanoate deaminase
VVKTTVFLKDINEFGQMNEVYGKFFTEGYPARSAVQAAALPLGAAVEIEAVALVPNA